MTKRKSRPPPDYDDYGYSYFPPSRPIKVEGGIQSRNQRGAFAANWWAKRWLSVLDSYGIGSRLQRGRSYARSGQVLNIDVQPGLVTADVQGSRPKPYAVEIQVNKLPDKEWERVLDTISEQAIFAAQLLDGTMPQEIETAFETADVSLFPTSTRDFVTECSCPDYSNPCKHIAAVYYLLGEQFDRNPFPIFTLRGHTREQVIEALRKRRSASVSETREEGSSIGTVIPAPSLNDQIADFWGSETFNWTAPQFTTPTVENAVLHRLGSPPGDLKKPLESLYRAMTVFVQTKISGNDEGN
ncbi:MAG: SWIM zinc finger family protein [Chloroflexi bacterium]|nr:SWIM zinc finger family protein [Chloroflexota bacterium]MCC6892936.1 SWIM zinc finger family protein [Anaerolineae bacterium]